MRTDNMDEDPLVALEKRVRRLERGSDLGYSSISEGSLRVASVEGLIVEGSERVTGLLVVDGTLTVAGTESITGSLIVSGGQVITGTFQISGTTTITGPTNISGALGLTGTMTVSGGGQVVVGSLTLDPGGPYGGRIASTGILYLQAASITATGNVNVVGDINVAQDVNVLGTMSATTKLFRVPNPLDESKYLQHGSTESPISGVEYPGRGTFDSTGECVIEMPAYFEALCKPSGRTLFITPVGRPFPTGADEVVDGQFTAYGEPGRDFCWLVKAERFGADFDVEPEIPTAPEVEEAA